MRVGCRLPRNTHRSKRVHKTSQRSSIAITTLQPPRAALEPSPFHLARQNRQDFADFVPLFRNMGSGRRGSTSSSSSQSAYNVPVSSTAAGTAGGWTGQGYTSAHLPAAYSMPFGLPPTVHRGRLLREPGEFAWPAEPPSPHGPPRPYAPAAGAGGDAAAIAAAAAAGDTPTPDAAAAEAVKQAAQRAQQQQQQRQPPRGSLLFGLGGAAAAESLAEARLAEHRVVVEEEHLRLECAMAALDAAGARAQRHWRRVSRLSEAEASWIGEDEEEEEESRGVRRAGGERLTGLFRHCRWKLAGNEHEGSEPGRFRPVLQPVVAAPPQAESRPSPSSSATSDAAAGLSASTMSMEDVGLQLARKCSRYIVDIVKTEAKGDGLADEGAGAGGDGGGDGADGGDGDNDDDVWGVIGPLSPAGGGGGGGGGIPSEGTPADGADAAALDVVEEVSSTGESPSARAQREEEERRLVEERVRQTLAAVAGRQDGGVGPRVDLGPGAGRWRMAVAIAAEAASGMGVTEAVVLVTPKGNRRGRLSLVDKVCVGRMKGGSAGICAVSVFVVVFGFAGVGWGMVVLVPARSVFCVEVWLLGLEGFGRADYWSLSVSARSLSMTKREMWLCQWFDQQV